jgi:glycogenin glucosyltransferase
LYDNRYAPAQNEFGQNISIIHFIGENKPWKYQRFADGKVLPLGSTWEGTKHMIQAWWNTWDMYYGQVS